MNFFRGDIHRLTRQGYAIDSQNASGKASNSMDPKSSVGESGINSMDSKPNSTDSKVDAMEFPLKSPSQTPIQKEITPRCKPLR